MSLGDAGIDAYKAVLVIINLGLGIVMTFLTSSIKEVRDNIKDRLKDQQDEIRSVREDLNQFKASAPHCYVLREDFIRSVSVLDHKMDRLGAELTTLSKNVAKLVGSGSRENSP